MRLNPQKNHVLCVPNGNMVVGKSRRESRHDFATLRVSTPLAFCLNREHCDLRGFSCGVKCRLGVLVLLLPQG